jgi:hypothetical protein
MTHETSSDGYENVKKYRAGTQKRLLLEAYANAPLWMGGLTDEEAAEAADLLHATYWMRAHNLREDETIEPTFLDAAQKVTRTRPGRAGLQRMVCHITTKGRALVRS